MAEKEMLQLQTTCGRLSLQSRTLSQLRSSISSSLLNANCVVKSNNLGTAIKVNANLPLCSNQLHGLNKKELSSSCKHFATSDDSGTSPYWDYSEKFGPNNWPKIWQTGENQSPIDIKSSKAIYKPSLNDPPLVFNNEPVRWKAFNSGCGVQYEPVNKDSDLIISGGPLKTPYTLEQFHFHWGKTNDMGSEHTIDGRSYPVELHLVHWNQVYGTFENAVDKPNGLAVLGVFLKLENSCNPNLGLFFSELDQINFKGKETYLRSSINPYSLLPTPREYYWTYPGSLTTPPLYESVTWIVHKQAIPISKLQLEQLRHLKAVEEGKDQIEAHPMGKDGCYHGNLPCIAGNHRPLQAINGRCLEASFESSKDEL